MPKKLNDNDGRENSTMLSGELTAMRFSQKPIFQPSYSFSNVPKAEADLKGSSLQRVTTREDFQRNTAEMLLICKEAMRRRPDSKGNGSKPLSLEYIADRLDIDDPLFGYLVRTDENLNNNTSWKRGMLQGYIAVTTFTNWQTTFRWNSLDEAAFGMDDRKMEAMRAKGIRKWDSDGSLAKALQATVRSGDINEEGIVWPRIAEISLLGALGCGRTLVSLVLEELECMKAAPNYNYDYVVLQATSNSVPFYESMGFVRVGALEDDFKRVKKSATEPSATNESDEVAVAQPVDEASPEKPEALAMPCEIVSGQRTTYTVQKGGETLVEIAKKLDVDVWDLLYLNTSLYKGLTSRSKLMKDTLIYAPAVPKDDHPAQHSGSSPKWYIAQENDTPRMLAKRFQLNCLELVEANNVRLPGLMSNSRLKKGTRVKLSHFDQQESLYKPYAHWSFPDDRFEEGEPSYMMALKLNRRRGNASKVQPFKASLSVPVSEYEPTELLLPPSPVSSIATDCDRSASRGLKAAQNLFNRVVRLKDGALADPSEFTYWYVLTFIPDLKWCHLAPMRQVGTFGPGKRRSSGRPRWKLVDESLGKEVDISSSYCIPMNSRCMKNSADADKEEWDIVSDSEQTSEAEKPPAKKKRKSWSQASLRKFPLTARLPGSSKMTRVRIVGCGIDNTRDAPKGSNRKRKKPSSMEKATTTSDHLLKRDEVEHAVPATKRQKMTNGQKKERDGAAHQPAQSVGQRPNRSSGFGTAAASINTPATKHTPAETFGSPRDRPRRTAAPFFLGEPSLRSPTLGLPGHGIRSRTATDAVTPLGGSTLPNIPYFGDRLHENAEFCIMHSSLSGEVPGTSSMTLGGSQKPQRVSVPDGCEYEAVCVER